MGTCFSAWMVPKLAAMAAGPAGMFHAAPERAACALNSAYATDEAGGYFIEGFGGRLYHRVSGAADVEIAPSLADWVWDRVVAFGADERRPGRIDAL